jgi:nucleotide-binding universal stress UspA family protein
VKPRTIVSVLGSLSATKDVAFTKALRLSRWYESDLHVIHVGSSNRVGERGVDAIRDDLVERATRLAEGPGAVTSPVLLVPGPPAARLVSPAAEGAIQFATDHGAFGLRAATEPDRAVKAGTL